MRIFSSRTNWTSATTELFRPLKVRAVAFLRPLKISVRPLRFESSEAWTMKGQTCHHHVLGVNKKAFLKNLNTVSSFTVWFKPPDFWLTDGPSLLLYFLTNDSPHGFRNLGRCNLRGVTDEHERHGFGGYGRCEFI